MVGMAIPAAVSAAALRAALGAALGLMLTAGPCHAADRPADEAAGRRLTQDLCMSCHAVGPTGGGTDMAPPLPAVAAARDDDSLRYFLAAPHGAMPPVSLTRQQIADIVAYLASLRPPAGPPPRPAGSSGSGR